MNKFIALFVLLVSPLVLAEVQMTPQQQEAANKLSAKGGLVIPLAADADSVLPMDIPRSKSGRTVAPLP